MYTYTFSWDKVHVFYQILKNKPGIRTAVLSTEKDVKWLVPGHPAIPGLGQGLLEAQVPPFRYPKAAFFFFLMAKGFESPPLRPQEVMLLRMLGL